MAKLVSITEIEINTPKKYEPLSPRKTLAYGKLNFKKINNIKIIKNNKLANSLFPLIKLTKNKLIRIINEWNPKRPLYPSIKFAPLIINRKHKEIKSNENKFEFNSQ